MSERINETETYFLVIEKSINRMSRFNKPSSVGVFLWGKTLNDITIIKVDNHGDRIVNIRPAGGDIEKIAAIIGAN